MPTIKLSSKQQKAFDLLSDPTVVELLFGGGAGGGKSLLVTLWAVIQCRMYPGITIGLGRREISNLGKTTVQTLLVETHSILGVESDDFRYVAPGNTSPGIYYKNGSSIPLIDLAPAPRDPNFDRFGSLPLTHVIIEEAGEVVHKAKSVISSRKNRWMNAKYGITGKTIMTCNPSQNFVRDEFYEPYLALGAGDFQVWDSGVVEVDGTERTAHRAFVKSLPTDNPFLSPNYIHTLQQLPDAERRRLLEGDWDFDDDDANLFKAHLFRSVPVANAEDDVFFGCDPARGGDATVFSMMRGTVVADIYKLDIPRQDNLDVGTYVAERYIAWVKERDGGYERAAVDAVGVGVSVLDACRRLGFYLNSFNAGATKGVRQLSRHGSIIDKPRSGDEPGIPLFNNIRSQNFYDMAQAATSGELVFIEGLPCFTELKRDLMAHKYATKERQTIVDSKDKVKARIGRSPDFADSLQAAWWCRANKPADIDIKLSGDSANGDSGFTSGLWDYTF